MSTAPQHTCASKSFTRAHPSNEAERQTREVKDVSSRLLVFRGNSHACHFSSFTSNGFTFFPCSVHKLTWSQRYAEAQPRATKQKETKCNSQTHNTTALQPNVFYTAIHRLPVTKDLPELHPPSKSLSGSTSFSWADTALAELTVADTTQPFAQHICSCSLHSVTRFQSPALGRASPFVTAYRLALNSTEPPFWWVKLFERHYAQSQASARS